MTLIFSGCLLHHLVSLVKWPHSEFTGGRLPPLESKRSKRNSPCHRTGSEAAWLQQICLTGAKPYRDQVCWIPHTSLHKAKTQTKPHFTLEVRELHWWVLIFSFLSVSKNNQKKMLKYTFLNGRKKVGCPSAHAKSWGGSLGPHFLSLSWEGPAWLLSSRSHTLIPALFITRQFWSTGLWLWLWFEASQLLTKATARAALMAETQVRVFPICQTSRSWCPLRVTPLSLSNEWTWKDKALKLTEVKGKLNHKFLQGSVNQC